MSYKRSKNEKKLREFFTYRDKANVKLGMYHYTGNNWSHRNSNRSVQENLKVIPGKYSVDSLQKTAILETLHIMRKALKSETCKSVR